MVDDEQCLKPPVGYCMIFLWRVASVKIIAIMGKWVISSGCKNINTHNRSQEHLR